MSKLIDEIRNLSPEERKQLADELKALDENAVPVTLQEGPVRTDQYGRKLNLSEQYDEDHPLQLLAKGHRETSVDMNGKKTIRRWTDEEVEEHNRQLIAEHEAEKATFLRGKGGMNGNERSNI